MTRQNNKPRITPPKKKLVSFDEIMTRKQPLAQKVEIWLDNLAEQEVKAAEREATEARNRANRSGEDEDQAKAEDAEHALAALEASYANMVVEFMFTSIGRVAKEALIAAHPPTQEQVSAMREELRQAGQPTTQRLQWNSETFPPALISRSCLSPQMDLEQATKLWNADNFSDAELGRLMAAASIVNA